jgi:hypothetical protein
MTFDDIVREDTAERFRLGLPAATWQEKRNVVALLPPLNPRQGHSVPELIWGFRRLREAQATRRLPPLGPMPQRAAAKDNGPLTVDRAARTVEVIWATGVRSRNMVQSLGWITEELDMSAGAVRMAQLRSGYAPVLNTHGRGSVRDVLGRVLVARIENGVGLATLRFSTAVDVEPIWQRIVDGALRGVSAGYRVHRYDQRRDVATGETIHVAVDWEPYEISMVPVPIDSEAMVR